MSGKHDVLNGGAAITPYIALKVMQHFREKAGSTSMSEYKLSPKELEVHRLLAEGQSYKMVSDELYISYFTVNNHVKKIYQKLQVHSLAEAVARGHKEGLFR